MSEPQDISFSGGPLDGAVLHTPVWLEKIILVDLGDRRVRYFYEKDENGLCVFSAVPRDKIEEFDKDFERSD